MSLTISLLIPDGIVLAADSLAATKSGFQFIGDLDVKCPECNKEFPIENLQLPPLPVTSSTMIVQKMTSLITEDEKHSIGIATYGIGILNEMTIYNHIRILNKKILFRSITDAIDKIIEYFSGQLEKHFGDLSNLPDDFYPIGFHIVGYEDDNPRTFLVHIGKEVRTEVIDKIGCTYGGQGFLIEKIWELHKQTPQLQIIYESLSLQDAIDLAEYLINATGDFYRFSNMIPEVGGDVDVALVTKYSGFKWIKCKTLTKVIEADR
ncbi:hypothetical protein K9N50_00525 [bacterium]|nr:hypothetical protein [bacterium]